MKCPKCHREVEPGSLYCQYCLTEIPWVKEYDSVETLMEKKKLEEEEEVPPHPLEIQQERGRGNWKVPVLIALALLVLGTAGWGIYRRGHTFSALYQKAQTAVERGEYEKAQKYVELALEQEGENLEGIILLGKIKAARGDYDSAVEILGELSEQNPESAQVAREYVKVLIQGKRGEEARDFLESLEEGPVLSELEDYICAEPALSLGSGTYGSAQKVELTGDCDRIYYTLDGSAPSAESTLYEEPVWISSGAVELKAVGVNSYGIPSKVVTARYVVVTGKPDKPLVSPPSGNFDTITQIEVQVPEGCKVYYAFDQEPTRESTEYATPISMPAGYHEFYAVALSANGEMSEMVSRTYYLQY